MYLVICLDQLNNDMNKKDVLEIWNLVQQKE